MRKIISRIVDAVASLGAAVASLGAVLLFAAPLHAQTTGGPGPGGPSPFETYFRDYLLALGTSPYCGSLFNTEVPNQEAQFVCALATTYGRGSGTGSQLRQLAPNQFSAENSQFKDFSGSQLHDLNARLSSIRAGANGFLITGLGDAPRGGSAGADGDALTPEFSRWGGFMNVSYDWGSRAATDAENALHAHSYELTVGADYRFSRRAVAGVILGYADDRLSFNNESNVVGGSVATFGYSLILFAQQEWDHGYISESVGEQSINQHLTRIGTFFDPGTLYQTSFVASSNATGSSLIAALNGGYDFNFQALTVEPYANFQYRGTRLDGFRESGASGTETGGSLWDINMQFDARSVTSQQGTVAVKVQYAAKPSFGVLVPYVDAGYTHEFNDGVYNVSGTFIGVYGSVPGFTLPADRPASNFETVTGGVTLVAKSGIQAYVRYRQVFGQRYVTDHTLGIGFRVEL